MKSKILWLQVSYLTAAIADFAVAISVLIPVRVGLTEFVYPMGLISAVAFSWGILLLFANRKPLERRWILIPTIVVISLLSGVRVYASSIYLIDFSITYLIFGIGLFALMGYSYYITQNLSSKV